MIIYGSRIYGGRNKVRHFGSCGQCGRYGRQTSYSGRRWGHLYFIPLLPLGGRVRVMGQCQKCSNGNHLPEKQVADLVQVAIRTIESALLAYASGSREIKTPDGTLLSALDEAMDALVILSMMGQSPTADDFRGQLLSLAPPLDALVLGARVAEFSGDVTTARRGYREAVAAAPDDFELLVRFGGFLQRQGSAVDALGVFDQAQSLRPDDAGCLVLRMGLLENLKDYPRFCDVFETGLRLGLELCHDKAVRKLYQKSAKKAQRQPVI